jgi:hypothetical protein
VGEPVRERIAIDRCPPLGDLVLAADGGLSPSHKAAMTMHLRQCGACRERLQQANAFIEAHADVMSDAMADFRSAGADASDSLDSVSDVAMDIGLDERLGAEYDSEAKAEARFQEFTRRLHKQKQDVIHHQPAPAARIRRWLPLAALIPLMIVGLTFSRMQTVVRAEELLSRASRHERSLSPDFWQRLHIRLTPGIPAFAPLVPAGPRPAAPRVKPFLAVRDVTGGVTLDAWPDATEASGGHVVLADTMARHGFDSRQPLSLSGVHAWRATPGEKRDEVSVSGDLLVLRTTTTVGELREVELTVRRTDYHVVKLAFVFEGIGRLEIAEIEDSTERLAKAASAAPVAPIASSPVAITGSTAAAPAGASVASAASAASLAARTNAGQQGLSRWLERTFGTRPAGKTFVPDLQRLVGQVRLQLAALDTLGRRYPETEVVEQWSDRDSAALHRRVDEAYGAISRDLNDLDLRIGILYGSTDRTSLPVTGAPADWRHRAALALAQAEAMDREVRRLLTFDDLPPAPGAGSGAGAGAGARGASAAPVVSTFSALWDVVHAPAGGPAGER